MSIFFENSFVYGVKTSTISLSFFLSSHDVNYINQALRFYNVDTPETHHPEKGTEPWGMAASQYTEMTLQKAVDEGKKIILEAGATGVESTYNRVVAYIWVDGILLNMALAEIGLATYGQSNASQEMYSDEIFNKAGTNMIRERRPFFFIYY